MSDWPPPTIRLRRQDLREIAEVLADLDRTASDALKIGMARYVAVRSAGYVEAVRDDLADLFVTEVALDVIANRIRSGLRTGQGAQPSQLVAFVGSFHPAWVSELTEFLDADDRRLRLSLGSLASVRRKVSHGDGDNVTTNRALEWAETAEAVTDWLVRRFNPRNDYYVPLGPTGSPAE